MLLERGGSLGAILELAKSPLVDDAIDTGVVEQRRGDPGLRAHTRMKHKKKAR